MANRRPEAKSEDAADSDRSRHLPESPVFIQLLLILAITASFLSTCHSGALLVAITLVSLNLLPVRFILEGTAQISVSLPLQPHLVGSNSP